MNTREQVTAHVKGWQDQGMCVGLASGAFDLFHAGHLSFLTGLRGHVDKLVVAVMDDANCARKGDGRPFIPAEQRAAIVAALSCVDAVFVFSEYGDDENLLAIDPDVFGRGDGHTLDMHEKNTIETWGIKVALIHTPRITSTTEIIKRIRS